MSVQYEVVHIERLHWSCWTSVTDSWEIIQHPTWNHAMDFCAFEIFSFHSLTCSLIPDKGLSVWSWTCYYTSEVVTTVFMIAFKEELGISTTHTGKDINSPCLQPNPFIRTSPLLRYLLQGQPLAGVVARPVVSTKSCGSLWPGRYAPWCDAMAKYSFDQLQHAPKMLTCAFFCKSNILAS